MFNPIIKRKVMAIVSKENVNLHVLNKKLNEFIAENQEEATEGKARLVKMTLRGDVHHFPTNIPFIGATIRCAGDKQAVFFIKRKKLAFVESGAIASETNVGDKFEIDNVQYVVEDTINGFPRYKPVFQNIKK